MKHSLYALFVLIVGIFGAILPVAAAGSISIKSVSGSCNQITVIYSASGVSSDPFPLTWTLAKRDETFIADGTFTSPGDGASLTETITVPLVPGAEDMFTLDIDGTADSKNFVVGACVPVSAESSSSSEPVIIPPCKLDNTRMDETCAAPIVTYSQHLDDGCLISIYSKYGRADGKIVLLLQATPAEIASAQAQGGNALIDTVDVVNLTSVSIYWLPETGEFQINAGPNEEGKVYVLNFTGCPATNVYTSNSFQKTE